MGVQKYSLTPIAPKNFQAVNTAISKGFLLMRLILKMNLLIKIKVGLPKLFWQYVSLFQR